MKKFLEKLIDYINEITNIVLQFLHKGESNRVMIFRMVSLFLWINILGVFLLAKINPFALLNPFKFLLVPPVDMRQEITLFYPASLENLHEKTDSRNKSNLVELRQRASFNQNYNSGNKETLLTENAREILQLLASSPTSIRGVRAIQNELLIKRIWLHEDKLVVHLDRVLIDAMKENQRQVLVSCIRKSLQANLGAFINVQLVIQ